MYYKIFLKNPFVCTSCYICLTRSECSNISIIDLILEAYSKYGTATVKLYFVGFCIDLCCLDYEFEGNPELCRECIKICPVKEAIIIRV